MDGNPAVLHRHGPTELGTARFPYRVG